MLIRPEKSVSHAVIDPPRRTLPSKSSGDFVPNFSSRYEQAFKTTAFCSVTPIGFLVKQKVSFIHQSHFFYHCSPHKKRTPAAIGCFHKRVEICTVIHESRSDMPK